MRLFDFSALFIKDFRVQNEVVIEPVEVSIDARGVVFEPIPGHIVPSQQNVHLVLTAQGCVRGNHYHRRGTEIVVVLGPALVRFRLAGADRDIEVPAHKALRFTFPPGTPHAFKNTGKDFMLLACFNTEKYDPTQPDSVPVCLIV